MYSQHLTFWHSTGTNVTLSYFGICHSRSKTKGTVRVYNQTKSYSVLAQKSWEKKSKAKASKNRPTTYFNYWKSMTSPDHFSPAPGDDHSYEEISEASSFSSFNLTVGENEDEWDSLSEFGFGEIEQESSEQRSRFSTGVEARLRSYFSCRTPGDSSNAGKVQKESVDFSLEEVMSEVEEEFCELDFILSDNEQPKMSKNSIDFRTLPKSSFDDRRAKARSRRDDSSFLVEQKLLGMLENQTAYTERETSKNNRSKPTSSKLQKRASGRMKPQAVSAETLDRPKEETRMRKFSKNLVPRFLTTRLRKVSGPKKREKEVARPEWADMKLRRVHGVKRSFLWPTKSRVSSSSKMRSGQARRSNDVWEHIL